MSIIYMLLAISVVVALAFLIAFLLSVRSGQFDDTYTPSVRMLFDDELIVEPKSSVEKTTENQSLNNNVNQ